MYLNEPIYNSVSDMSMLELAKYLYPLPRSLTGRGIDHSFKIFESIHTEFTRLSYPSGQSVFDWTIPPVWNVRSAFIQDESGNKICDFSVNNLHLVGYSHSIDVTLSLDQLLPHLHTREDLPTAVPYVTSYYSKNWGFCIPYSQLKSLKPGNYRCYIDSSFEEGCLDLIEAVIPGESSQELFFSSYLCHPSMANNELSGPVLISQIMKYVKSLPLRKYTYRFVLLPESIGSVAYLSTRLRELKANVISGFNLSCVGDERRYTHLLSRSGTSLADLALASALQSRNNVVTKSFAFRGSDERQYNSPGINLPVCGFSRSKYCDFPEYHTSLDDFKVVTSAGLDGSFQVMKDVIDAFETDLYPKTSVLCEPQLGKRGLYPNISKTTFINSDERIVDDLSIRMDVLAYSDGDTSIFNISDLAGCSLRRVIDEVNLLKRHELLH